MALFSTTSGEAQKLQNSLWMLAEGRQSRKAFWKNHREGRDSSCGELGRNLGDRGLEVSAQHLSESPPDQKMVGTSPQKEGWSVPCSLCFTGLNLGALGVSKTLGRTLCAAFPNTPLLSVWMKLLLPGAQPARKQVDKRGG